MMYRIISFLVSNRMFAIIFTLAIALLAWAKLPSLQISQYPNIEIPMLTINVILPGASSNAIEKRVVDKIEEEIENVRRVKKIDSRIGNSYAQVVVEFERSVDIDVEYTDVFARLNNLKTELPDDVEIVVLKQNPTDRIVSFIIGLSSETSNHAERLSVANELKQRIRQVRGLENLTIMQPAEEVQIALDFARMGRFGVSIEQVISALKNANQYLPTGHYTVGDKTISLLANASGFRSIEQIKETILVSTLGVAVSIADISDVRIRFSDKAILTSVAGNPSIWLTMKLNENANVFRVKKDLDSILESYQSALGESMQLSWLFDVEAGVDAKIGELVSNILMGIFILAVVLFFAVGYRSAFIISMMLPVALFLSIVGLSLTDYGIQEISLAGFIISLGLIVDSGIVVTENAFKLKTYSGYSTQESAITGTATVMAPLISSTLTTALAFAPIFLLDSMTGLFLHSFVVTIWLCLAASLVAAVAFAALLLARIGTENKFMGLPAVPSFMNAMKPFRDVKYVAALEFFIAKPWRLLVSVSIALGFSLWAAAQLEITIFPDSDEPYFTITIHADKDRSTAFMQSLSQEIVQLAQNEEEVEQCASIVGATFPGVHTGIKWYPDARNVGTVFCKVGFRNAKALNRLTDRIDEKLLPLSAGADLDAAAFVNGEGVDDDDVEVILRGRDIERLRETARRLEDRLRAAELKGVARFNNPGRSNWFAANIHFKPMVASALGVSRLAVDQALVLVTHGYKVDEFRQISGEVLPIMLKAVTDSDDPLSSFDRVLVPSHTGELIPLSQLVAISYNEDEYDIYHQQFSPELVLGIKAVAGYSVSQLTKDVQDALSTYEVPADMSLSYGGELAASEDAFGGAGKYVGVIGLMILAIFVLQFRSVLQPLIIFAAIPLSFIGGFVLLWISNQALSFLAFVGLTSLMGIVINNSILLVDEGNRIHRTNPTLTSTHIAIRAGVNRFMPIFLTSLTSTCGLLPLALGDSMFKPLAIVVIGGLTTSTVLTLICVPVLYALLPMKQRSVDYTASLESPNQ